VREGGRHTEASSYRSYASYPCAVTNERRPHHEEGRTGSPVELENRSRDISVSAEAGTEGTAGTPGGTPGHRHRDDAAE
jgi:hypothetical protein